MEPAWARHLPAGLAPEAVDLLPGASLTAGWADRWDADPAHPTLYAGERWILASEVDERSRIVAGRWAAAGLRIGDRIVMSATPSADLVIAHVAALRLGLVVVPVNGAYREREVAHIVSDCAPAAAVVDDRTCGDWIVAAAAASVVLTSPAVELPDTDDELVLDAAAPDDGALICYTSGTTGAPKGALLTHGNAFATAEALRIAWRWSAADRLILALPLFHVHGLAIGLHGSLGTGASVVLLPRFDAAGVLDAARDHDGTMFFGVPTMYARLAACVRARELGGLRLCVSGSAPLPAELHRELESVAGIRVLERYGMTETLMNVSNPYEGERRAGTVGFPLPGVELRLADADPAGEILVRGPNVFPGYWRRPEATRDAFEPDGWFHTGDVGEFDADGYLQIVGRSKELIISGGFNVYPREVEEVLLEHPGVADVAVIGVPSDEWGEVVTAVVVADGPVDESVLLDYAAELLAPYKRPRRVRFATEIPRNALGKVLRSEL
jgi:malonyl-CoA/methylmalonyl-CoA synthetase